MSRALTDASNFDSITKNAWDADFITTNWTAASMMQDQLSAEALAEDHADTGTNCFDQVPEVFHNHYATEPNFTDFLNTSTHEKRHSMITSEHEWDQIVTEYLCSLTRKTAGKALPPRAQLDEIREILKTDLRNNLPPRAQGYQFAERRDRSWVRRTFQLGTGDRVLKVDPKAGRQRGFRKNERMSLRQDLVKAGVLVQEEVVVPREELYQRLVSAHLACDHGGRDQTCERMRLMGYMPPMKELVTQFCKACPPCQRKAPLRRRPGRQTSLEGFVAPVHSSLQSADALLSGVGFGPILHHLETNIANGESSQAISGFFPVPNAASQEETSNSWQAIQTSTFTQFEDWHGSIDPQEPCFEGSSDDLFVPGGGDPQESMDWNVDVLWYQGPQLASQSQPQQTQYSCSVATEAPSPGSDEHMVGAAAGLSPEDVALLEDDDFRLFMWGTF